LIRQVSCYTLLSGYRLPWPPSCCLYQSTPFLGSHERGVRHLIPTFGSSHSASSAYQKWPTWSSHSLPTVQLRDRGFIPIESLRISRGIYFPGTSNHGFTGYNCSMSSSYPGGNFRGNQLLDSSISLSPLYPSQTIDLHVRTASDFHQSFLRLRPAQA
jgi:hypothetical protein